MQTQRFPVRRWLRHGYEVSTDPKRLDFGFVWEELHGSYWGKGLTRAEVKKASENSLVVFGLYRPDGKQIGYARLVTDAVRFAYLMDVVVAKSERGKGWGLWLNECIVGHPDLGKVRAWMLATRDAHALYKKAGWKPLRRPGRFMVRRSA